MLLNGSPGVRDETTWTKESLFAGERLYCTVQAETIEAIDLEVMKLAESRSLMSKQEIACNIAHSLMETAMRQVMATRMPVSLAQWEGAARLVYLSCHQQERKGNGTIRRNEEAV